jgi:segregation and condensation protein A
LRELSILQLAEAFGRALEQALAPARSGRARADLSRWGEFLAMAAHLALLRSRLLLPPEAAEAQAAQRDAEALRRLLLERAVLRGAAGWLEGRIQLGREVFGRGVTQAERNASARVADIADLFRACLLVLRVPELAESYAPAVPGLWRVPDALARITRLLADGREGELGVYLPIVERDRADHDLRCRAALASTLVAGLELARTESVSLAQSAPWETIQLTTAVRDAT